MAQEHVVQRGEVAVDVIVHRHRLLRLVATFGSQTLLDHITLFVERVGLRLSSLMLAPLLRQVVAERHSVVQSDG
jgi:hypothetical protein